MKLDGNVIKREIPCRGLSAPLGRFGPRGRERERSALDSLILSSPDSNLEVLVFVSKFPNIAVLC